MKKSTTHGGARKGAGRIKTDDPKVPIITSARFSEIESIGGPAIAKDIAAAAIRRAINKAKEKLEK